MSTGVEMSSKDYGLLAKNGAGDLLEVAMGPHHPSTHGVFRMDVVLDGETVVKLKPVFDCFHRNPKNNRERNPERQALAKDWPLNHERR